jgi:prepilin-type N-terminal cleavage/methylation domain-containing protein
MLRINKQGFTLIELMVVIVIIGVLASLAIPRFTDASNKAKVAEAPRVLASFESAYLAGVAEGNVKKENLVFDDAAVVSKWFTYTAAGTGLTEGTPTTSDNCTAQVKVAIGKITTAENLITTYDQPTDKFTHSVTGANLSKYVPNFLP